MEEVQNYLLIFNEEKLHSFHKEGIKKFVKYWETVIENNEEYIID